jgi:hypothetical protein
MRPFTAVTGVRIPLGTPFLADLVRRCAKKCHGVLGNKHSITDSLGAPDPANDPSRCGRSARLS